MGVSDPFCPIIGGRQQQPIYFNWKLLEKHKKETLASLKELLPDTDKASEGLGSDTFDKEYYVEQDSSYETNVEPRCFAVAVNFYIDEIPSPPPDPTSLKKGYSTLEVDVDMRSFWDFKGKTWTKFCHSSADEWGFILELGTSIWRSDAIIMHYTYFAPYNVIKECDNFGYDDDKFDQLQRNMHMDFIETIKEGKTIKYVPYCMSIHPQAFRFIVVGDNSVDCPPDLLWDICSNTDIPKEIREKWLEMSYTDALAAIRAHFSYIHDYFVRHNALISTFEKLRKSDIKKGFGLIEPYKERKKRKRELKEAGVIKKRAKTGVPCIDKWLEEKDAEKQKKLDLWFVEKLEEELKKLLLNEMDGKEELIGSSLIWFSSKFRDSVKKYLVDHKEKVKSWLTDEQIEKILKCLNTNPEEIEIKPWLSSEQKGKIPKTLSE